MYLPSYVSVIIVFQICYDNVAEYNPRHAKPGYHSTLLRFSCDDKIPSPSPASAAFRAPVPEA